MKTLFKKILIATDGSENNKKAIEKGLELAKLLNAKISALYVVDNSAFAGIPPEGMITSAITLLVKEGERVIKDVKDRGKELGVEVDGEIVEGIPSVEILKRSVSYDLIVVGTLGRTGLLSLLMGSTAERVIKQSKCPVLVVKNEG